MDITTDIVEELELEAESVICSKETSLQTLFSLAELLGIPKATLENKKRLAVSRVVRDHISQSLEVNEDDLNAQHEFLTGVLDILKLSEKKDPRELTGVGESLQAEPESIPTDNSDPMESNEDAGNPESEIRTLQAQLDRLKSAASKGVNKGAVSRGQGNIGSAYNLTVPMTNILRRDFKISGLIGDPNDRNTMTYISLVKQIDAGQTKGFNDSEIVEGVIKAMTPSLKLKRYLDSMQNLTLKDLKEILQAHYGRKSTTDLFTELAKLSQTVEEDALTFLTRALALRQQVIFACDQGRGSEIHYTPEQVQSLFLRRLELGMRDPTIRAKMGPHLTSTGISDQRLITTLSDIISREEEHRQLIGGVRPKARINEVEVAGFCDENSSNKSKKEPKAGALQTKVEAMEVQIKGLSEKMDKLLINQVEAQYNISSFRRKRRPACTKCKQESKEESCSHCFGCGSGEHFKQNCPKRNTQMQGNERGLSRRGAR